MKARSKILLRRRRVAQMLAEGMSVHEIAKTLHMRWDYVEADVKVIQADPNNVDYLSPKRALGRLLDAYDDLEREARQHLKLSIEQGKLDAANRWFESVRRIAEDRGRVLHQIGVLNRATQEITETPREPRLEDRLSPRARRMLTRIALAEKVGHDWSADLQVRDRKALEPEPDPDFKPGGA